MSKERSTHSADDGLGPGAERAQMVGELVCALVELAVAQRLRRSQTSATASGVRAACWANSSGMVAFGIGARGVVPVGQDGAALVRRENVEAADGAGGLGRGRGQQPGEALRPAWRRVASSNRSPAYSSTPVDAGGRAVGGALLGERERQVELGAGDRHLREAGAQSRQLEAHLGVVLERQHHLEQRMMRQRARRVDDLHQPLERQLLVAVGRTGCRRAPAPARSRKLGLPEVSVRSTRVLTKNPTRSSSA